MKTYQTDPLPLAAWFSFTRIVFCSMFILVNIPLLSAKNILVRDFAITHSDVHGKALFKHGRLLSPEEGTDMPNFEIALSLEDVAGNISNVTFKDMRPVKVCPIACDMVVSSSSGSELERLNKCDCATYTDGDYTAVVTFSLDGSVEGVVKINDKYTRVQSDFKEEHGVVANDLDGENVPCGANAEPSGVEEDSAPAVFTAEHNSGDRRILKVDRWEKCYPLDEKAQIFYMGASFGSALFERFNRNINELKRYLEATVAEANMVYVAQLNTYLVIRHMEIADAGSVWDNPGCEKSIYDHFDDYRKSHSSRPSRQGLWHLFDDCHKAGAAIGIAYPGTLCENNGYQSQITYHGMNTWLTFAHEVGHAFGAYHSFEDGQGKTGGIMDYGDGLLNGEYQFNSKYRKDEVCKHITNSYGRCTPFRELAFKEKNCGNGKLDIGEECECPEGQKSCGCCENCMLRPNAKCSPVGNPCCTDTCEYKPTSSENLCTARNGKLGYCTNGQCDISVCERYSYLIEFCAIREDNPCKQKCRVTTTAGNVQCHTMTGHIKNGREINNVVDGSYCITENGKNGACSNGVCLHSGVVLPPVNPVPPHTPVQPSPETTSPPTTKAPTNFPTPKPTSKAPTPKPTPQPTPDTPQCSIDSTLCRFENNPAGTNFCSLKEDCPSDHVFLQSDNFGHRCSNRPANDNSCGCCAKVIGDDSEAPSPRPTPRPTPRPNPRGRETTTPTLIEPFKTSGKNKKDDSSGGLVAGILAFFAMLALAALFVLIRRRRRKSKQNRTSPVGFALANENKISTSKNDFSTNISPDGSSALDPFYLESREISQKQSQVPKIKDITQSQSSVTSFDYADNKQQAGTNHINFNNYLPPPMPPQLVKPPVQVKLNSTAPLHPSWSNTGTYDAPPIITNKKEVFYSYETLLRMKKEGQVMNGVNRTKLEMHLSPKDFQRLFNMSKSEFMSLKPWRQMEMKKNLDLF